MSCHIRIASINAKMGLPEVSLGVIPGYGDNFKDLQILLENKTLELISIGMISQRSFTMGIGKKFVNKKN